MNILLQELSATVPDFEHVLRAVIRLTVALLTGCLLGWERESAQKAAGLRTHAMVAVGAALFALIGTTAHATSEDLSRVIHGVAAGIGFIGTGTILKRANAGEGEIVGLTTAASIWLTAAVGLAAGAGLNAAALVGAVAGFGILRLFAPAGGPHPKTNHGELVHEEDEHATHA